jgi:hypothetical protein
MVTNYHQHDRAVLHPLKPIVIHNTAIKILTVASSLN